jgi:hypothetical protein
MIDLQFGAVSSNLTVEQASELKRNAFNAQVMLTNLGRLPFDSTFGPLRLEALWAPSALRGIEGEQNPRSSHRQRLAASHANQPRTNPRPPRGYGSRTPQSLRDLTHFPKLAVQNRFKQTRLARMRISMNLRSE